MIFANTSIEDVRGYWDTHPCNIRHSSREVGTRKYFDEVEVEKYFFEPHIPRFAEFEKWQGKKVLEIGCGIGTDTINFARRGARVTAADLSEESLKLARHRAKMYGLEDKITFFQANAEELTRVIPEEPYDLIYSFGVIHHTPNPERVIGELAHYAHSGTVVKIMIYHRYSWPVIWILLTKGRGAFWKLDELVAKYSESQNCPVTYTYSRKSAKKLLSGFEITNITIENPPSDANHFRKLYRMFRPLYYVLYPIMKYGGKSFGWHLCITAKKS